MSQAPLPPYWLVGIQGLVKPLVQLYVFGFPGQDVVTETVLEGLDALTDLLKKIRQEVAKAEAQPMVAVPSNCKDVRYFRVIVPELPVKEDEQQISTLRHGDIFQGSYKGGERLGRMEGGWVSIPTITRKSWEVSFPFAHELPEQFAKKSPVEFLAYDMDLGAVSQLRSEALAISSKLCELPVASEMKELCGALHTGTWMARQTAYGSDFECKMISRPDPVTLRTAVDAVQQFLSEITDDTTGGEQTNRDVEQPLLGRVKSVTTEIIKEGIRIGFACFALYTFARDLSKLRVVWMQKASVREGIERSLIELSISGNVASMLSAIALVGVYSDKEDSQQQALVGCIGAWLDPFDNMLWTCCTPCRLLVGLAIGGRLDSEGLAKMPRTQRLYIQGLAIVYKPVYHLLMLFAMPAILAYIWLFLGLLGIAGTVVCAVQQRLPLLAEFRPATRLIKMMTKRHMERHTSQWFYYLFIPIGLTLLLTFSVSVAVRFYEGDSYRDAILLTWDGRHASTYFGYLTDMTTTCWEKLAHALDITWLVA